MQYVPEPPAVPDDRRPRGRAHLRYEDVSQDGRVMLTALPQAIGGVIWARALADHPITEQMRQTGIIPILTRFVLDGRDGRVAVGKPLEAVGAYELAHTADEAGEVDRVLLNLWVELTGTSSRTHAPAPPDAGAPVPVGRVFAEHAFTRLFAPPGQRKVRRLEHPDLPEVPPERREQRRPAALLELPRGARPIDEGLVVDPAPVVFGLAHTDSNQHVNSLVYPRLFQEAALRRFAALGRSTSLLARWAEIGYRKPCFAGQTMHIALRAFEIDGKLAASGCFVPPGSSLSRPHCTVRMLFDE